LRTTDRRGGEARKFPTVDALSWGLCGQAAALTAKATVANKQRFTEEIMYKPSNHCAGNVLAENHQ
jgi:hypothetical protein